MGIFPRTYVLSREQHHSQTLGVLPTVCFILNNTYESQATDAANPHQSPYYLFCPGICASARTFFYCTRVTSKSLLLLRVVQDLLGILTCHMPLVKSTSENLIGREPSQ